MSVENKTRVARVPRTGAAAEGPARVTLVLCLSCGFAVGRSPPYAAAGRLAQAEPLTDDPGLERAQSPQCRAHHRSILVDDDVLVGCGAVGQRQLGQALANALVVRRSVSLPRAGAAGPRGIGRPRRDWASFEPGSPPAAAPRARSSSTALRYCRRRRCDVLRTLDQRAVAGQGTDDETPNPVCGIGREPSRVGRRIKVPCRADQPEVSFLDQVVQGDPTLFVVADGAEHQPQVRRDQLLLRRPRRPALPRSASVRSSLAESRRALSCSLRGQRPPRRCGDAMRLERAAAMSSPGAAMPLIPCLRVIDPLETRWLARGPEFQSAVGFMTSFFEAIGSRSRPMSTSRSKPLLSGPDDAARLAGHGHGQGASAKASRRRRRASTAARAVGKPTLRGVVPTSVDRTQIPEPGVVAGAKLVNEPRRIHHELFTRCPVMNQARSVRPSRFNMVAGHRCRENRDAIVPQHLFEVAIVLALPEKSVAANLPGVRSPGSMILLLA